MENLGKQIKEIRDAYDLSQDRFGKRLGLSGKTISAYENNKITPPLKTLKKIAKVYKIDLYNIPEEYESDLNKKLEEIYEALSNLKSVIYKGLSF